MALAALGAVTVLDVSPRTAEAAPNESPFAGGWSGTWSVPERGVAGIYDWTISDSGRITGTVYDDTLVSGGTVVGQIRADGALMLTCYAPNDEPGSGFNGFSFQGTAVFDEAGRLVVEALGLGDPWSERPTLFAILEQS
jgi:hypothetical protein